MSTCIDCNGKGVAYGHICGTCFGSNEAIAALVTRAEAAEARAERMKLALEAIVREDVVHCDRCAGDCVPATHQEDIGERGSWYLCDDCAEGARESGRRQRVSPFEQDAHVEIARAALKEPTS